MTDGVGMAVGAAVTCDGARRGGAVVGRVPGRHCQQHRTDDDVPLKDLAMQVDAFLVDQAPDRDRTVPRP